MGLSITNGQTTVPDMARRTDAALDPYLEHLRSLRFVRDVHVRASRPKAATDTDASIVLETDHGSFEFSVERMTSHLSKQHAEWLVSRAGSRPGPWLVAAPAIGRPLAERFIHHHVNYVDLAGNCSIDLGGTLSAHIEGRRRPTNVETDARRRSMRGPAYKVLFAYLADPNLVDAPLRDTAHRAGGVSPQTVGDLRSELVDRRLVVRTKGHHGWDPARKDEAIDLFVHGYIGGLRDKLRIGRFRSRYENPEERERELGMRIGDGHRWSFGGSAAAQRLGGHYRDDETLIHVLDAPPDFAKSLGLIPDATRGNVILQHALGDAAFGTSPPHVVHPLLVYADLLASANERASEAAVMIRERFLSKTPA